MELVIEGVVGVIGAASAISAYRRVKHRRRRSQEDDLLTPTGALAGRTVLLTGANTGIGAAAAELLARKGATVVCACRDLDKAQQAADAINARLDRLRQQQQKQEQQANIPDAAATALVAAGSASGPPVIGRAEPAPAPLDLGSLYSVQAFAGAYHRSGRPLHVLVNNAAVMLPKREVVDAWAADGEAGNDEEAVMRRPVERTMLVNHLGPWLLTALLLPTLKDTGRREGSPSRVIFVSSRLEGRGNSARFLEAWLRDPAVTPAPSSPSPNTPDAPTPDPEVPYSAFAAYGASKLANLLTAQHLDRQRLGWALAHPQAPPHATTATSGTRTAPIGTMPDNTLAGATPSSSSSPPWDPSDQHVCVYACTPGMVHTQLNRWAPWALRAAFFPLSWALLQTPQQGARPIVFLAASERVEGRGGGFWATSQDKQQPFEVVEVDSSPESQDVVLAHRLWAVSEELAAPFLGPLEEKDGGKE